MKFPLANVASTIVLVSLMLNACSGGAAPPRSSVARDNAADVVPGEVIVQFRPGTSAQRIDAVLQATGTRIERHLGMPLVYSLRFSGDIPVEEMVQRFKSYPEVENVEPNRVIRLEPPRAPPGLKRNE